MELQEKKFYRPKEAAVYLGIGRSTFLKWVKDGKIPAGHKLSGRCTVWGKETLDSFVIMSSIK